MRTKVNGGTWGLLANAGLSCVIICWFTLCGSARAASTPVDDISAAESRNEQRILVIDDVERSLALASKDLPENIFPSAPIATKLSDFPFYNQEGGRTAAIVSIGEPDDIDPGGNSDFSEHSLRDDLYFVYSLDNVATGARESTLQRLQRLRRSKLYGRYVVIPRAEILKTGFHSVEIAFYMQSENIKPEDVPNIKPVPTTRARYSREIVLSGTSLHKDGDLVSHEGSYRIPDTWRSILLRENVRRIWVECAVQVDRSGVPVDAPLRHVRPVAVETDRNLYLVVQTVASVNAKHGYVVQFDNNAFRLTGDPKSNSPKAIRALMEAYHRNLQHAFNSVPLQADEDLSSRTPPGEFHFRRDYQVSKVLEGFRGPYKELSYYNVKWWRVGAEELYSVLPAHKGEFGGSGINIALQVSHSLTVSVGASNEYAEASADQIILYQKAILGTMQDAIKITAAEFKGIPNGTGYDINFAALKLP